MKISLGHLTLIKYAWISDIPAALIAVHFHKAFDVIERKHFILLITLHELWQILYPTYEVTIY